MADPTPETLAKRRLISRRAAELWATNRYSREQALLIALVEFLEREKGKSDGKAAD